MRKLVLYVIGFCLSMALMGCDNAVPTSDSISTAIFHAPTFGSLRQKTFPIAAYNSSVTVSGECPREATGLSISFNNEVTWTPLVASGADDLDCSDGGFSFIIADCSVDLGFSASSPIGEIHTAYLRAEAGSKISDTSDINVRLSLPYRLKFSSINLGGGEMLGSNYKIIGQIGSVSGGTMSGSRYSIKTKAGE